MNDTHFIARNKSVVNFNLNARTRFLSNFLKDFSDKILKIRKKQNFKIKKNQEREKKTHLLNFSFLDILCLVGSLHAKRKEKE